MGFTEDIKKRPSVSKKWEFVKDIMATHISGKPPTRLYRTRRPLESTNAYALTYREENFQPITKQPFLTAIAAILESANHIYISVDGLTDTTEEWLKDYHIHASGKMYDLKDYVVNYVGKMIESDPNAVLVHLPVHPTEELIPDYREELPNFNNIQNQYIDIDTKIISSDWIHLVTQYELWYNAGEWIYKADEKKEHTAPYYFMLTAEATRIAIPYMADGKIEYRVEDYYFNDLDHPPFTIIGNNTVMEEIDGVVEEYNESTYSGGVAIANKMLGMDSDADILNTRYTYPEKYMHVERCGHPQCVSCSDPKSPYSGLHVIYDFTDPDNPTCSPCNQCGGTGNAMPDTSPLGTHFVAKSDVFDENGKFTPLIGFVTPPLDAPKYMAEQVAYMYERMERALFIMSQNMTNQSGESKAYDVKQKVAVISRAVKNIYSIYESSLNTISGFLRQPEEVEVLLPPDFNIKTSQDITIELGDARNTSSLYTSELTKELVLKKFGNTAENRRVVEFLELTDLLFGMTPDEVLKTVISYPQSMRARLQVIHDKALAVLNKIVRENENFLSLTDEQLKALFDAQIDILLPPAEIVSPIA